MNKIGNSRFVVAIAAIGVAFATLPASAVPYPSEERVLVGGNESMYARESALGRPLDVVRIYRQWGQTSLPELNLPYMRGIADNGRRSIFLSASIRWTEWRSEANQTGRAHPYCKFPPTHPQTGAPMAKSWFKAFADGNYDARLRSWLEDVESLGHPDSPAFLSIMPEIDRLDANPETALYRQCVGTPEEFRAGWQRAHAVAAGTVVGGRNLNAEDGEGGTLVWVPVFTDYSFYTTAGIDEPVREIVQFSTGLPSPNAPLDERTLSIARATPWLPPAGTWDHFAVDVFNWSGAVPNEPAPSRVKVGPPNGDRWRSLEVLMRAPLLWAEHNAPRLDGKDATVFMAEVGSVPDPTRPERRADWIHEMCQYLHQEPRVIGALYFDFFNTRLATWNWTQQSTGWYASSTPTGTDHASVARWAELMSSLRAGGSQQCGGQPPDPEPPDPEPPDPEPPVDIEWVTNTGVETSLTGWTGTYGAGASVTRVAGGHESNWAIRVQATLASPGNVGFSANPRWVTSTVAGTTYTGSAWVRAETPGQRQVLQLREWDGATLVGSERVELQAPNTEWHKISVPITAQRSGSSLAYAVYVAYVSSPIGFWADDLSLTSPG